MEEGGDLELEVPLGHARACIGKRGGGSVREGTGKWYGRERGGGGDEAKPRREERRQRVKKTGSPLRLGSSQSGPAHSDADRQSESARRAWREGILRSGRAKKRLRRDVRGGS